MGLAVGLSVLSGCVRQRVPPEELVVLIESPPRNIDPRYTTTSIDYKLTYLSFARLIDVDTQSLEPRFDLAESVTPLPPGPGAPLRYEVTLRPAKFSDGSDVTAVDVLYTIEHYLDEKHGSAGLRRRFSESGLIQPIEIAGPRTLRLSYSHSYSSIITDLDFSIVKHGSFEKPSEVGLPIGAGPFVPVSEAGEVTRFVRNAFGRGGAAAFDFEAFERAVALQVRALDNVLDVTFWPLPQQRDEAMAKRRIGVGFTGMGNTLAMLCLRYDLPEGRTMAARIAECMRDAAYAASVDLAREKGVFPKFDATGYLAEGTFASRLPESLQAAIRAHGIRNSHLLSIAPTGTVSLAFADNASNGIEPPFSWMYKRKKREADGSMAEYAVEDHSWRLYRELGGDVSKLPEYFVSALEMSAQDHIAMMETVQPFVDTAISKTVNIPADYPYEDFKDLYLQAWRARLKGLATYRPNAILGSVLEVSTPAPAPAAAAPTPAPAAPVVDPMRTVIESRPKGGLSAVAEKVEYWTQEGHKTLYIIVSFLPVPTGVGNHTVDRAIEFFMPVGQSGESQQWITSSMRLLSLAARGGFLERALSDMRKVAWDRGPVRLGTHQKEDGTQVPMWHDSEVAAVAFAIQNIQAQRNSAHTRDYNRRSTDIPSESDTLLPQQESALATAPLPVMAGKKCGECGAHAVIRKDGCDYCTQCGHMGSCG